MIFDFTLEDVDTWLACDRDAGIRVWQDSGFFLAIAREALNIYWSNPGWRLEFRRGTGPEEIQESYLAVARAAVAVQFENMKYGNERYTKKPGDFETVEHFANTVRRNSSYRIQEQIKESGHAKFEGLVQNLPQGHPQDNGASSAPGQPDQQPSTAPGPRVISVDTPPSGSDDSAATLDKFMRAMGLDPEGLLRTQETSQVVRDLADALFTGFDGYLGANRRRKDLRAHLHTLFEAFCSQLRDHNMTSEERGTQARMLVLRFLSDPKDEANRDPRAYFAAQPDFNQNTYNSKNRRIRGAFDTFRQSGQGQEILRNHGFTGAIS